MPMRVLLLVSALGLSAFVATVAAQGLLASGFDPGEQQVSEFVHTAAGPLLRVGLLAWSISLLSLAVLTSASAWRRGAPDRLGRLQAATLLLAAVCVALLAFFPTDRGEEVAAVVTQVTDAGRVHDAASGLATAALFAAAVIGLARSDGPLRNLTLALLATAILASVVLLAIGDPLPGLRQRLLLAAGCVWQAAWLLELRGRVATSARSSAGSRCSTS